MPIRTPIRIQTRILIRHLMSGTPLRPFPGGIWSLLGVSVLGGLTALPILLFFSESMAWLIFHTAAVIFGALIGAAFATVGLSIWHLERAEGRQVWMGRDGFFLL